MLKVGGAVGARAQKPPLAHGLCLPTREKEISLLRLLFCPRPQTHPQEGVLILSLTHKETRLEVKDTHEGRAEV